MSTNWSSMKGRMLPSGKKIERGLSKAFPNQPVPPLDLDALDPNMLAIGWTWDDETQAWKLVSVPLADRAIHCYEIGATGAGKTKHLESKVIQDVHFQRGFGVISPHSDLITNVKGHIVCYVERTGDGSVYDRTVVIDPCNPKKTVVFNVLEELPGVSAAKQSQELLSTFKRIWEDSWGPRMEDLLRNSLIALGEAKLTLGDLPKFLTSQDFRTQVLELVVNPVARAYFERFDSLSNRERLTWMEPVMNKTNAFLSDDRVRMMLSHPTSSFSLREIMDNNMILLVSTDKGQLGDQISNLLNALVMSKIQMAAFSRSDIPESQRQAWTLYLDEFQNFVSETFAVTLSEGRKYKLMTEMYHQSLEQVPPDIRSIILGNTGIQVYFRINRRDAEMLAKEGFTYSGYEVKEVDESGHRYWSLGEEWERHTEELQRLQPRCCYAAHKIAGGMVPMRTIDVKPPWEVLGMDEDGFYPYLASLPIGEKFLREREELVKEAAQVDDAGVAGDGFTDEERDFLVCLADNRDTPISGLYKAIGVGWSKGNQIRDGLKEQGLIEEIETRMGKNGKRAIFLIPTSEALGRLGKEPPPGRGGAIHTFVQQMVIDGAKAKGYSAEIEKPIPGGAVDVHLEKDGHRIGIEIAVVSKPERELAHIRRILDAGYERVISVFADERLLARTQEAMNGIFSDSEIARIRLVPLSKVSGLV